MHKNLKALAAKGFQNGLRQDDLSCCAVIRQRTVSITRVGSFRQYQEFLRAMNRLVEHPLSFHHKEFIFRFRKMLKATTETQAVPEVSLRPARGHSTRLQGAIRRSEVT